MHELRYLGGYSEKVTTQVRRLIDGEKLSEVLLQKYPKPHQVRTDRALYDFAIRIKNDRLRSSPPVAKVVYDFRIDAFHNALGLHTFVSRVQGAKLKAKHEIRVAAVFREMPEEFLRMIVVHELAHLREKEHNRAFYSLCEHMEPEYQQLEFDTRLFLTHIDIVGPLY